MTSLGDYIFSPTNSKTFIGWYRLPDDWLRDGTVASEWREELLEHLYGPSWRGGNSDGSRDMVLNTEEHLLTGAEIIERPWVAA